MIKGKLFTISNLLSFTRLLLVIPFWIFLDNLNNESFRHYTILLGVIAVITDVLDGYFARKFNEVTETGKIVDPLADKVLVVSVIIKLFIINEISLFYFLIIAVRDVLILTGGIIVTKKLGRVLPSDKIGKATVLAITAVILLILLNISRDQIYFIIIYYLSILLIVISFSNYVFIAIRELKKKSI